MIAITRRSFIYTCSAAVAAASSRLTLAAFGPAGSGSKDMLLVVFLRGGADLLSLVAPRDGADRGYYEAARPSLALPVQGEGALLPLDAAFGLHPAAAGLHALWDAGKLAIVHACGMFVDTRSHFDAQEFIELGTPGSRSVASGWLARHLRSAGGEASALMPALAVGDGQPTSLVGASRTVAMNDPDGFDIATGPWAWRDAQRLAMRHLYGEAGTAVHGAGSQALDAMDLVEAYAGSAVPPANGAVYPDTDFGRHLRLLAQLLRLDLGLQAATVDLGGWDTHVEQAYGASGRFADLARTLSDGLAAFCQDLGGPGSDVPLRRVTVVVQSEFGRRVRENADRGTDHGHGNAILVLGGRVLGGLKGSWPGLRPDALYDGADVAVTTDYRRVLSEILIRRLGNSRLTTVFPGYSGYSPLGVVEGTDLPVV